MQGNENSDFFKYRKPAEVVFPTVAKSSDSYPELI